ncbi:cytochrome c [Pseudomonas sp. GD03860]|uniref:c-type cytochrome n=1 Tax=Pseudomonas TaxID=286 RepID=UPI00236328B6|nr:MULTISPECIES: cytochrome c [Pseudomonas]MDD2060048.1 cytochrome c [Pseudomonas putida]MDH0636532.1 cytochrome c [Pseudomonas sp. GD03860]
MMLKRLSVVLLACLTLTACGGVDPNSPLGQRKTIFKQMLKTSEDLGGMLRGRLAFDGQKFADGAVKLDALSREPWKHFPQVREEDETSARPEVWQQQARFQDLAQQMEASTAELVAVTRTQPLQAAELAAPMNKVEAACKACHTEFRNH